MNDKIKQYQDKIVKFAMRLRDPKFAGVMTFLVIVLLISWSGVKAIQSNYGPVSYTHLAGNQRIKTDHFSGY